MTDTVGYCIRHFLQAQYQIHYIVFIQVYHLCLYCRTGSGCKRVFACGGYGFTVYAAMVECVSRYHLAFKFIPAKAPRAFGVQFCVEYDLPTAESGRTHIRNTGIR